MAGAQMMKRIPRIKFPQRHPNPAGSASKQQIPSSAQEAQQPHKSEVPAPPTNTAVGGRASLQPHRTPVSEKEIESILLGGNF
ncbi:unnamed protein product [Spirodela intermedia]|uniref:Uncharacterized protein n=2 Tax=Spirodela intermedia TaxID=51605 RepID=A0A7I8KI73_SPIIN|nr:unnamed protein product [Spirodela intermedia]CAA6661053.1 unnamed protein product [Spirodela intermedia]CAA7397420.1 unnamed protein product [Spirodela intermedia]